MAETKQGGVSAHGGPVHRIVGRCRGRFARAGEGTHSIACQASPRTRCLNVTRQVTMLMPRAGSAEQRERGRIDVETERWKHWRRREMPAGAGRGWRRAVSTVHLCAIPWHRRVTGRTGSCPILEESWIAFLERISEDVVAASSRLYVKGMARLVTQMSGRSTTTSRNPEAVQGAFTICGRCVPPAIRLKAI